MIQRKNSKILSANIMSLPVSGSPATDSLSVLHRRLIWESNHFLLWWLDQITFSSVRSSIASQITVVSNIVSHMTEQDVLYSDQQDLGKKKSAKRKRDEADPIAENVVTASSSGEKKLSTKEERKRRRLEREKLLEQIPLVDEDGIRYTKQQIRHMRKRVERGLHPIETAAEKHARLAQDAQLRKEEEAELAGLMDDDREESIEQTSENVDVHDVETNNDDTEEELYAYEKRPKVSSETLAERPAKPSNPNKKKRSKPVPLDYVCSACNNANGQPPHWIYDCVNKKTIPGTNQVSRKKRGFQDPSETKLFVSGLPFDATAKDVSDLFASKADVSVLHVKLIKFEDTKRCKGQAFVAFATLDEAKKALRLNGTVIPSVMTSAKSKDAVVNKQKKELKLKVTKVLNRVATKQSNKGNAATHD